MSRDQAAIIPVDVCTDQACVESDTESVIVRDRDPKSPACPLQILHIRILENGPAVLVVEDVIRLTWKIFCNLKRLGTGRCNWNISPAARPVFFLRSSSMRKTSSKDLIDSSILL